MTNNDKIIVKTYSELFETLSPGAKISLIESLTKSLKKDIDKKATKKSFEPSGDFIAEKTPEEIIAELKANRENVNGAKSEKERRKKFFATFGALKDDAAAGEILDNLKSHRKFRKKGIKF